MKNSIAPERNWLNISVSEPSWLFGKDLDLDPAVGFLFDPLHRFAARTLSGCATGRVVSVFELEFRRRLGDPGHRDRRAGGSAG